MTSMGNKVAKSLNKNGTRTLETDILWCNDLPFKSVTTTATLRLHQISYVYMTITFSMKFMAGHECDFPISWEFEIMFPLNYYSGSQNQECKKFYIAKV